MTETLCRLKQLFLTTVYSTVDFQQQTFAPLSKKQYLNIAPQRNTA